MARSHSRDNQLSMHRLNGLSEQRELRSIAELRGVLTETFGIEVPVDAELDAALGRVLG